MFRFYLKLTNSALVGNAKQNFNGSFKWILGNMKMYSSVPSAFNVDDMTRLLDNDNFEMRSSLKNFLSSQPLMMPVYNVTLEQEREFAYKRLQFVCDNNFISALDFRDNPLRIFAAHELCAIVDPSMTTKMTVQFNLFGGTVFKLGTEKHHSELLPGVDSLKDVGCFALTELGFGNNAVEMETTAILDKGSMELIVNTPTTLAQKYWITNGALHAHHCIVFAKLDIQGSQHGVQAILVRIRDDHLNPMPGVTINDMGPKMGLNGVDNAKLSFNNIRVPVTNMLDRFSHIDENGKFTSKIKPGRSQFLAAADQLLSGRLCIASRAEDLHKLFLLDIFERDLGMLMLENLITSGTAQQIVLESQRLCKKIAPSALNLVEVFGLNAQMLAAPIAGDWIKYNTYDNCGNLHKEGHFRYLVITLSKMASTWERSNTVSRMSTSLHPNIDFFNETFHRSSERIYAGVGSNAHISTSF